MSNEWKCEGEKTDSGLESDKVILLLYHTFLFLNPSIIFKVVKKKRNEKKICGWELPRSSQPTDLRLLPLLASWEMSTCYRKF